MDETRSENDGTRERPSSLTVRHKPFASWVIFDTEATGFKRRPKITELCMLAVRTDELKSTSRPRVVNKLQLCFNPESAIEPQASRLTGLYNDVLEQMAPFRDQASLITGFLTTLPQPVCIIAHNGHRFDFPLLQSEVREAGCPFPAEAEVYCADSLEAFRVLDGLPAVPEWVVQREREEKRRKRLVCDATSSTSAVNNDETASSVTVTTDTAAVEARDEDFQQVESGAVSVSKRQMSCTDSSTDGSVSEAKLPKTDTDAVPSLGSETSVSDSDLVAAYNAAFAEAGLGSPIPVMADASLQSEQETTPTKDPSWTHTRHAPEPGVKKPPPLSFNTAERERVARRLFAEEPDSLKDGSAQGAVDDASSQQSTLEVLSADSAAPCSSSQGSLPDEKLVQAVERAQSVITSLPPFRSGAGEPDSIAPDRAGTSQHSEPSEKQPPSCHEVEAAAASMKTNVTPATPSTPAETGVEQARSTQNQVSEVTSSSSSSAAKPTPHNSPNGSLPSGTTPKLSYRLGEVYKRQFGRCPQAAHTAEDDCISLLRIMASKSSAFISFVEGQAVRFDSIKPMY